MIVNDLFKPITSLDDHAAFAPPAPASTPALQPKQRQRQRTGSSGQRSSKYDAASTDDENRRHWSNADGLSANSANDVATRYKLRSRARYECGNNGYAGGLVRGRAETTIGVCPRLQLTLPETFALPEFPHNPLTTPSGAARAIEARWNEWADAIGLADKLRLMDKCETREGEAFATFFNNPILEGVQLDLKLVEADQVCSPDFNPNEANAVDGIRFDAYGNPVSYDILRRHPGETNWAAGSPFEYDRYPASRVIHLFDPDRAGQARGIPAITPALPLYAILRRFTLAGLGAAEIGSMITGVIEDSDATSVSVNDDDPVEDDDEFDQIPFSRNMWLTMPTGKRAKAFDSAKPSPEYGKYKAEILTEAGRSIGATRGRSTGSSAEYNFSSGRLDLLPEQQGTRIRRDRCRRIVIDRVYKAWLAEAVLIPGYLPADLPPATTWQKRWRWDGFGSVDPVKDATANEIMLESGQTTLEAVCAERGDDWDEVLEQQAAEMRKRRELGLPEPGAKIAAPTATAPSTTKRKPEPAHAQSEDDSDA